MAPVRPEEQKAAPPPSDLDAILEKIRSEEGPVRKEGFQALLRMGVDKAVGALLERVVEPGKTDDSPARIALHGLAVHTTCPCAEPGERMAFSPAAATRLEGRPREVRRFILEELRIAGAADAVGVIAALLADPDLGDAALFALESTTAPAAAEALGAALPGARDSRMRAAMLRALGSKGHAAAVGAILAEAASEDTAVRLAAFDALARFGEARAEPSIREGIEKGSGRERLEAAHAYLRLAEKLLASGKRREARDMHLRLIEPAMEDHLKCAGLIGLAASGDDESVAKIVPLATSEDAAVRHLALKALEALPGEAAAGALRAAREKTKS
jgi:hypothetical protein